MLDELSREKLEALARAFARNWLAHDGLWFQAVERSHGIEEATRLDAEAWSRFSPIEARRIREILDLPERGGLEALRTALCWRMYALLNRQHSELENGRLRFYMDGCRVQAARREKGLGLFACKSVGLVEYGSFASAIDPRILTSCIACPPDVHDGGFVCGWEFRMDGT